LEEEIEVVEVVEVVEVEEMSWESEPNVSGTSLKG